MSEKMRNFALDLRQHTPILAMAALSLKLYLYMTEEEIRQMARNRDNMFKVDLLNQLKEKDERIRLLEKENGELRDGKDKQQALSNLADENTELKQTVVDLRAENATLKEELEYLKQVKEVADKAKELNIDYKSIINMLQRQIYCSKSEMTRYQNGEIDPNNPGLMDMDADSLAKHLIEESRNIKPTTQPSAESDKDEKPLPNHSEPKPAVNAKAKKVGYSGRKRVYDASDVEEISLIKMPEDAKILHRYDNKSGYDIWTVNMFAYQPPKVIRREYKIARISTPGVGLSTVGHPEYIVKGVSVHPSLARFYLDSKFGLNLSENSILKVLKTLRNNVPQSTFNNWMHQIMACVRERLEGLMLEAIRQSKTTYNDETRLLVRSRESKNEKFKYRMEYVHACLSMEKKLISMIYKEGSRSHEVQEEAFFKDSKIKIFMADRAPLYRAIVKDFIEYDLIRAACWVHARRCFLQAFGSDMRVEIFLKMINSLFWFEEESRRLGHNPQQRLRYRLRHSLGIVNRIFELAREMKQDGNEYGSLVHDALDYILNDEKAFKVFLTHGEIEISNNAVEYMFRHIAMGRRTWLHTGSHSAAQNIAFMYSLVESCRLNEINFGEYIEDILTRIMKGETADASFLPNKWTKRPETSTQTA